MLLKQQPKKGLRVSMSTKRKLLIFYDWFYPGFKAGGPIQSLTNLASFLIKEFEVYVVTGAHDLHETKAYKSVKINSWNTIKLPGSKEAISVFYADTKALNTKLITHFLIQITPAVIYLNGIFSYRFFLLPLLSAKKKEVKVVICPRGMLKEGALSGKSFKKKVYLACLKLFRLFNLVYWHATTIEEAADIALHFPVNKGIVVASNIPKAPRANVSFLLKKKGELKLVYLSLINEHKNLLLLLQMLKETDAKITLDIYGPVTDEAYWSRCEVIISQMQEKVTYKGLVQPENVQEVLSCYHALILFTKGENFGHAIYESLSVGRPVITSHFTPWQNLYEEKAGVNVTVENKKECLERINEFAQMKQEDFNVFCTGAHTLSANYYQNLDAEKQYKEMF